MDLLAYFHTALGEDRDDLIERCQDVWLYLYQKMFRRYHNEELAEMVVGAAGEVDPDAIPERHLIASEELRQTIYEFQVEAIAKGEGGMTGVFRN